MFVGYDFCARVYDVVGVRGRRRRDGVLRGRWTVWLLLLLLGGRVVLLRLWRLRRRRMRRRSRRKGLVGWCVGKVMFGVRGWMLVWR